MTTFTCAVIVYMQQMAGCGTIVLAAKQEQLKGFAKSNYIYASDFDPDVDFVAL